MRKKDKRESFYFDRFTIKKWGCIPNVTTLPDTLILIFAFFFSFLLFYILHFFLKIGWKKIQELKRVHFMQNDKSLQISLAWGKSPLISFYCAYITFNTFLSPGCLRYREESPTLDTKNWTLSRKTDAVYCGKTASFSSLGFKLVGKEKVKQNCRRQM